MRFALLILVLVCSVLFTEIENVNAQSVSGVGIKPSIIEEPADPGEILKEKITVTNLSEVSNTYYLFTRDIAGVTGGNAPIFAEQDAEITGYELSEWISFNETEITLEPGEEKIIEITISVPDAATPGSHFGGVFVSLEPPRLRQSGAGIGFDVANIIVIQIAGDVLQSAQIRSFSTNKLVYGSTNVDFFARLENKGNSLIRPTGPLEIFNMFGKQVAVLNFNDTQGGVFPHTIRDFTINWTDENVGFGRYQATLALSYGLPGRKSTISSSLSFWILPMNIITPALIILGIVLLSSYIAVKMYINRRIHALSGGRRLVQRRRRGGTPLLLTVAIILLVVTALLLLILLLLFA